MRTVSRLILATASVVAVIRLASAVAALEPSFTSRVDLVYVPVIVSDKRGNPIGNLDRGEFQILEDGQPRKIEFFAKPAGHSPLFVVLVVDASESLAPKVEVLRTVLRRWLSEIGLLKSTELAVVQVGSEVRLVCPFGSPPETLSTALESLAPGGGTRLYDGIWLTVRELLGKKVGRKMVVVVSDGADTHSVVGEEDVERSLMSDWIQLFSVGIEDEGYHKNWTLLRRLSKLTGGEFFRTSVSGDRLRTVFDGIVTELGNQYILAFTPGPPTTDEEFRKIRIVLGRKGLTAKYREGYTRSSERPR